MSIPVGQEEERRRELGGFLRKRRESLVRADHDLPPVGRSRLTGLRREEVAYHSGVSVTWYTWLEQGREINPSRQVLDAVARTMRLSAAEHAYVLALAGFAPAPVDHLEPGTPAPAHVRRLLDAWATAPAFAVSPDWMIVGWNAAYEALYPNVARVDDTDRNLLLLIFTDPYVRQMLPDWEVTSRHFLAEYRAEAGPHLGHPSHVRLVGRLLDASADFAAAWEERRIEPFASRERRFHHAAVGDLTFEHHRLTPSDPSDLHLVVYLPATAADEAGVRRLLQND